MMNGTKAIWITALALVGAAVALALLPDRGPQPVVPTMQMRPETAAAPTASQPTAAQPTAAQPTTPDADETKAAPALVRDPNAVSLGLDQVIPEATVLPGNIVPMKDPATGEDMLLADGRFQIRGKGTAEEPYRVSWECLASASDSFVPRLKEYQIPQRVAMLNGKWVRIDGYLAFPLMVSETTNMLIMLNQWDGCCIGVPPTPYDAIEVRLQHAAKRSSRHATFQFGGVQGKLRVDPYLVENFLSGLYVLDEAALRTDVQPEL